MNGSGICWPIAFGRGQVPTEWFTGIPKSAHRNVLGIHSWWLPVNAETICVVDAAINHEILPGGYLECISVREAGLVASATTGQAIFEPKGVMAPRWYPVTCRAMDAAGRESRFTPSRERFLATKSLGHRAPIQR